jgi:hypothetical protein
VKVDCIESVLKDALDMTGDNNEFTHVDKVSQVKVGRLYGVKIILIYTLTL